MHNGLTIRKRPAVLLAGGALLCTEAWQSGLLHRAYPSADVWASKPLLTSREFESHRFHHQTSGTASVAAVTAPDHQPRDCAPKRMIMLQYTPCRASFPAAFGPVSKMTDCARHEPPFTRQAD